MIFFTLEIEEMEPESVVYKPEEMPDIGSNNVNLFLVGVRNKGRSMDLLKERYEPGSDTGPEMLQHPGEEGGIVISGEIELTVGFQIHHLKAGDGYYFNSNRPHRFRNVSDEVCEIFSANPSI